MHVVVLILAGPPLAGSILALIWWLLRGRTAAAAGSAVRATSAVSGILLIAGGAIALILQVQGLLPLEVSFWNSEWRFVAPLVLGIIGIVVLAFPVRFRRGEGTAALTRRSLLTYTRRSNLVVATTLLAAVIAVTVAAGSASSPDPETGHYTWYTVHPSVHAYAGTTIFGWYYSIPSLVLIAVMVLAVAGTLFLIARPSVAEDPALDASVRRARARNVLLAGSGALLVHLSTIFGSLAAAASIRLSFATSEGPVSSWSTFAAFGTAFQYVAFIALALGFACWTSIVLSAFDRPRRRQSLAAS